VVKREVFVLLVVYGIGKIVEENILVIKVDSRESINQPPFGRVIDYMTYGGIYREVYESQNKVTEEKGGEADE